LICRGSESLSLLKQTLLPIPDHRRAQGKLYDLPHLLLFSILAVMSGATSYRRIHPFIRAHGVTNRFESDGLPSAELQGKVQFERNAGQQETSR
jgi:hypothetical protein